MLRAILVAFACCALPAVAAAQQPQIAVKPQFRAGEKIAVTVSSPVPATRFDLSLDHEGKPVQVAHGPARAGEHVQLVLPGPGHYEGKLVVTFRDGNRATNDLQFDAVVAGASMVMGYTRDHLDLDAHRLEFTLSRPAAHAELKVIGEDGKELATATADYHHEHPGTWLPITWSPTGPGTVLALELRATSADGARAGVRLVPWSVSVPHTEVVFETGKADIRPSEEPKLDAIYQRVADEVGKARKRVPDVPVKLYIAGYTDTVGSNADNRKLSTARAKTIAEWFLNRGLPLPIIYAGFGEEVLRVKTPDETDNAANRRADYIIAFDEPMIARGVRATWQKAQ
jgi:outer membrane protein OmpA-like peptidoglycan-associated protein